MMPKKFTTKTRLKIPKGFNKAVEKQIIKHERKVVEQKYHIFTSALTSLSSSGELVDLSAPLRGDGDINRDGDRLCPLSIDFGYNLNGETFSSTVRVIVVRWKVNNATSAIAPGGILHSLAGDNGVISPYVHDLRHQFSVMYDKTHNVSNNGPELVSVRKKIKCPKVQIDFVSGTTNGINKYYALFLTDRSLGTSCIGTCYGSFNFTDQ